MNARGIDFTGLAYLAALGLVGYVAYRIMKAGPQAAAAIATDVKKVVAAVNPANPDNVFNRAATAVVQATTGDSSASPGTKAWEIMNPGAVARERAMFAPSPGYGAATSAAIDNEDAELGRAMLAQLDRTTQWGSGWSAADQEDADQGAAMQRAGAGVPMGVSTNFSYLSRTGRSF